MNYTKPEVTTLGAAIAVIEILSNGKVNSTSDSVHPRSGVPAYDLDE